MVGIFQKPDHICLHTLWCAYIHYDVVTSSMAHLLVLQVAAIIPTFTIGHNRFNDPMWAYVGAPQL
jgi:hypothetical protein